MPLTDGGKEEAETFDDLFVVVQAAIVRADHQDDFSGLIAIQFAMVYTPKHVFDTVPSAAQVLETGRTHQIRAQFSSRGLPLCGDRKYGAQSDGPLGLWSYQIAFFHPQTNERLVFAHDPPQAEPWLAFFDTLKEK